MRNLQVRTDLGGGRAPGQGRWDRRPAGRPELLQLLQRRPDRYPEPPGDDAAQMRGGDHGRSIRSSWRGAISPSNSVRAPPQDP